MKIATINGIDIAYRDEGAGQPILFICSATWRSKTRRSRGCRWAATSASRSGGVIVSGSPR